MEIVAAKYDIADVNEVAEAQMHLTPQQRKELKLLLRQFPKQFYG